MKDLQLQTPQRDQNSANRRMKAVSDLKMNPRKTAKKSLNPVFKDNSEDDLAVLESLKDFSEASDDNLFAESAENLLASVHPADSPPSESLSASDVTSTQSSSLVTEMAYTKKPAVDSLTMEGSVEAELVMKFLREARTQVMKSKDLGPSKRVMKALINIIIEETRGGVYEDDEWLEKLLSSKSIVTLLIFIMLFFPLLMVWLLNSGSNGSFTGPTPT